MKRSILVLFMVISVLFISMNAAAGVFTISEVRSDSSFQGAELGLELGPIELTGGADALYIRGELTDTIQLISPYDTYIDVSGLLLVPHAGVKLHMGGGSSFPYLRARYFKLMPNFTYTIENNNEEIELPEVDKVIEEVKEKMGVQGGRLGIGATYKINEHIGISAETGANIYFHKLNFLESGSEAYPQNLEVGAMLGTTYSTLSLSIYF
ncbi:MAG: hypothetical protein K9L75_01860 [Spirochaetia bacterium]|nr:hypothetical protein [Spirochaetia bacterium]